MRKEYNSQCVSQRTLEVQHHLLAAKHPSQSHAMIMTPSSFPFPPPSITQFYSFQVLGPNRSLLTRRRKQTVENEAYLAVPETMGSGFRGMSTHSLVYAIHNYPSLKRKGRIYAANVTCMTPKVHTFIIFPLISTKRG
jgi:hypothetical protein